jgi:ATP-dependent protease HslVU (ClpYQ) peptidase subunit
VTTIVGIQGDGFAVIGNDSRLSEMDSGGFVSQIMTIRSNANKIAKNGKYLLGAAGDMRAINILHHVFIPPTPTANLSGLQLDKFFTNKFIPELRECFDKTGYASPEKESSDHKAEQSSEIIAVVNATIYVIDSSYAWASDQSGVYALGTGASYALGALKALTGKSKLTPASAKTLCIKALNIAAQYDPHTGSPFYTHIQEQ